MSTEEENKNGKYNDICRDFLRNVCHRGDSCKYLHPRDGSTEQPPLCKDFLNKGCFRKNCKFLHCSEEEYYANSTPVCKNFLLGRCRRGRACRYLHKEEPPMLPNRPPPYPYRNGMDPYVSPPPYSAPPPYDAELQEDLKRLKYENNLLLQDNVELKRKHEELLKENEYLTKENENLKREKSKMESYWSSYSSHIAPELTGSAQIQENYQRKNDNLPLVSYPLGSNSQDTNPYKRARVY